MRDLYEILGVEKNCSKAELKSAYRKLAKKYHPDVNPDNKEAEENFKEVNFAYEILSDDNRRQKYDTYGEASFNANAAGGGGFGGFSDMKIFLKVFLEILEASVDLEASDLLQEIQIDQEKEKILNFIWI